MTNEELAQRVERGYKYKEMPTKDEIIKLFRYDNGKLIKRERVDYPKEWNTKYANKECSTKNNYGYYVTRIKNIAYLVHRIIWVYHHGKISTYCGIDHIDGNPSNNKIENLRLATHSQNQANTKKRKGTTSKYVGVYFCEKSKKWIAQCAYKKQRIYVGSFENEKCAAIARDEKMSELHGEYCRNNIETRMKNDMP